MRSMKRLEEHFGSLTGLNEQIQLLATGEHLTPHVAMLDVLPMGLLHEPGIEDELLDESPARYEDCLKALIAAINESFPDPKAERGVEPAEAPPGEISTTSAPSDSAAAMASSGA
jgi:hypothetical protein